MSRYIVVEGRTYLWRDILNLRREQRKATRQPQPTLFELHEDSRPASQKTPAGRYLEPTLFDERREQ